MKDTHAVTRGNAPLPICATTLLRLIARTMAAALIEDKVVGDADSSADVRLAGNIRQQKERNTEHQLRS